MAQIVYYVTSAARLTGGRRAGRLRGADRQLRQRARRLGRPADGRCRSSQLVIGSQPQRHPHPLPRHRRSWRRARWCRRSARAWTSRCQSNFERLLFELNGRDGGLTAEQLQRFRADGLARRSSPTSIDAAAPSVRRRPRRRRRDRSRSSPSTYADDRRAGRPAHRGRPRRGARRSAATRRCRWSRWPPPTRPSSPTPSRGHRRPPAAAGAPRRPARAARAHRRRCRTTSPRSRRSSTPRRLTLSVAAARRRCAGSAR